MWPIFHNVDQLDSIHAAWRLKKISPPVVTVAGKKAGGTPGGIEAAIGSLPKAQGLAQSLGQSAPPSPSVEATGQAGGAGGAGGGESEVVEEEKQRTVRWNHGGKGRPNSSDTAIILFLFLLPPLSFYFLPSCSTTVGDRNKNRSRNRNRNRNRLNICYLGIVPL